MPSSNDLFIGIESGFKMDFDTPVVKAFDMH